MKQLPERGTLVLALIAGVSINGSFAALFSGLVPFSIFPIIALVLAVYTLSQRYKDSTMAEGLPSLAVAWFVLGILLYSTFIRVVHPDIGSNFVPSILSVVLLFWIFARMRTRKKQTTDPHHDEMNEG
ncbi:YijD family membrane protein [Citrobacter sp. JGM124]|uniref:YijD family membrane protein n=1 Tax=Citrobacter sp. JGM124 TaxID=2799789 RepID=UPI001BA52081|nr:YijD family membrane protein [Citrobacter sp. JGM124]MBS0849703.1 YijD family membrane protein [Citrobacter sp. JGM124]